MVTLSPLVVRLNKWVDQRRNDGGSAAHEIREQVFVGFSLGGGGLAVGGLSGLLAVRRVLGDWAQGSAATAVLGPYVFAVLGLSQGLFAALFIPLVYDTRPGFSPAPLSEGSYMRWNVFIILLSEAAFLAAVLVARRKYSMPNPTPCGHCGYDLTGNVSGRCPECGSKAGGP